ncbi:hypothetical protein Tco_0819869 [Tanacetum coccineum]|uniref:Uncharacterized protein n=1 Tax=Tanacetum coccineum TaxID=301880 RepID=A0ABQ5A7U1_9ASTR
MFNQSWNDMTLINAEVLSNFVSLQCLSSLLNALLQNTMAEQNVPAQPPTRTDEQIVPRSQWLTIGKSNLLFNAQKIQKNPIFQISVDILSNTNFFQAFTASANVPAIYLQQFWNTMKYNEKTGVYSCQVDEQWFDLSADLLRKALAITPVIPAHPFELPPSGNTVIDFVNELGYPEPVEIERLLAVTKYDINAVYGITHWWFRRKEFYINKHSESSDRKAVRSQMRILSVISVKVFEKYGYNYLREIILRRADYQEYKISEKDFKNLHPNDFEDLFLLNIQEKLNHLPKTDKTSLHTAVNMWIRNLVIRNRVGDLQLGIKSYQTKINLERPNWDATDYYFKEDSSTIRAQRMTREEAKTSSLQSRKDYRSEGSIKVWKALLEEE